MLVLWQQVGRSTLPTSISMQLLTLLDGGPWEVGQLRAEEEKEVALCLNFWRDWLVNPGRPDYGSDWSLCAGLQ